MKAAYIILYLGELAVEECDNIKMELKKGLRA
jgi:hypothetical protein